MGINGRTMAALVCLAVVIALAGCGGDSGGSGGLADRDGRIVFTSGANVDVISGAGTNRQLLIADASQACISKNGEQVVFVRGNNIFILDRKTNVERNLTNNPPGVIVSDPELSRTGEKVVFVSRTAPGAVPEIRVMDNTGANNHLVVTDGDDPTFFSQGNSIAFVRGNNIFESDLDGKIVEPLTNNPPDVVVSSPVFSQDDHNMFFTSQSTAPGSVPEIRSLRKDADESRLVITNASSPTISPNDDAIAFVRNGQIFAIDTNGQRLRQLTAGPNDSDPCWGR